MWALKLEYYRTLYFHSYKNAFDTAVAYIITDIDLWEYFADDYSKSKGDKEEWLAERLAQGYGSDIVEIYQIQFED